MEKYKFYPLEDGEDIEKVKYWYKKAALQGHDLAFEKCKELGIEL